MITKNEITLLRGLTKKEPLACKLNAGEKVLLYARWFTLEVPKELWDPTFEDWADASESTINWRAVMPPGEGEYATASRWTNPEDNVALVKLIADSGVALVHPAIYDVVMKQIPEPEFRVFPGEKSFVVICSAGVMIGGVAQVKV